MDALEHYIAELESALAPVPGHEDWRLAERSRRIEEAARNVIAAWDAENTPEP